MASRIGLHWCGVPPVVSDLGRFALTRGGVAGSGRVFVLEGVGRKLAGLPSDAPVVARVTSSRGTVQGVQATPNPEQGGWRLSFELQPGDEKLAELRATLFVGDAPVTETWVYRWTA